MINHLDDDIGAQYMQTLFLDWLLQNQDSHGYNMLIVRAGRQHKLVGIDKGLSWSDNHTGINDIIRGPGAEVFDAYRNGIIDIDFDVLGPMAERLEQFSDANWREVMRPVAQSLVPIIQDSNTLWNTGFFSGYHHLHGLGEDEIIEGLLERFVEIKREAPDNFRSFVRSLQNGRRNMLGLTTDDLPDWVPPWDRWKTLTPVDDRFLDELRQAGAAGKSVVYDSSVVHGGYVHFDILELPNGAEVVRAQFRVRDGPQAAAFMAEPPRRRERQRSSQNVQRVDSYSR